MSQSLPNARTPAAEARAPAESAPITRSGWRGPWFGYAAAVAGVGAAAALREALGAAGLLQGAPFLLFTLPVAVSAWVGGMGPGLLATALAAGWINLFYFEPRFTLGASPGEAAMLAVFLAEGAVISWLGGARRAAVASLRLALDETEARVARRTADLHAANRRLADEAEERRRAEREARDKDHRFRLLVEGVQDYAVFMLDPLGNVVSWNVGAERISGYAAADVVGRHFSLFYPPEDVAAGKPARELETATREGRYFEEGQRVRKDGSRYWANVVLTAIREGSGAGALRGFAKVTRDVTALRAADEALRSLNARLEVSNRELQDFASVASHDLQEPLRKIQAFGDRLGQKYADGLGEEGRDYLSRMKNAAGRMQALINDLLTFSRVTTRARAFEPVDLKRVAAEVLSDLEARVEQASAAVELGDLPTIEADPLQMRQLLQNLIGNALKFRKPGEAPAVRVWAEAADEGLLEAGAAAIAPAGGGAAAADPADSASGISLRPAPRPAVRLMVRDNGIGFDEKYLDRIFTVFQRLHGRTEFEGTGIGLAVCRKIVERHGGAITARSRPGEGATFIATLPLHQPKGADGHAAGS